MTDIALSLRAGPVVVVLGANQEKIEPELVGLPVIMPVNTGWGEGLASSLRVGLAALPNEPIDAFLILLTDQPHVTADLLRQLINAAQETGQGIVASRYSTGRYDVVRHSGAGGAGTTWSGIPERAVRPAEPVHLGVPALFSIRYKTEFMAFTGDVGARKLIRQYPDDCIEVAFPLGAVDLDTPQDVEQWQRTVNSQQ
jgi:molybdenum cofactor cytidylyltransferase